MASGGNSVQQNSDRSNNNISNSSQEGSTASIHDCVLYKMSHNGEKKDYNLEFIVSIVQHTQITPGLYKKTTGFAGETSYEISSVEPNDTIINAFHIETGPENDWIMNESQIPIVAESHMRELKNKNHETIILCIREPIPKIYTTTGDIFIEPMNGIISTNSVFNEFQRLEYVPGSSSNNSAPGKIEEVIDVTALTSSMKTRNLLFNLNCVEDFSKIKSLQKGVAKDELLSQAVNHFINLLTVKIELDPEDRILNGEFLSELSNMGIIVASKNDENKPIVDLLKHGDKFLTDKSYKDFVNCSDVYCNAGRNFTKIFRLQKENEKFRELINATLSRYSAQVTACKKFFDDNAKDPSITQIFSELNKYVLNQIVRPKKFLIVNVKTRAKQDENGNRKPVNERYAMKTDSNRTYLAIDALTTAVPLYKKVEGNDVMNEELLNRDGTVKDERKNKLVCGPFDCISDPNLDNKGIADLPQIKQIVEMLLIHIYVCVFGKGISGSGKTTLMINNIHGTTEDAKKGVMFHLCNQLNGDTRFNCKTIIMKRSEICAKTGSCDIDDDEYMFTWQTVNGVEGFFCVTQDFTTKYKVAGCVGNNEQNPTSYTCTIEKKSLHEVAEILLTKTRAVNATALNKSSSRSHAQIVLRIKCYGGDKKDRFLTIVDAAGKENIITCSYAMLVKYANSFSEDGKNRSYSGVVDNILSSKRDDVVDFTRVENLLPLVSGSSSSSAAGGGGDRKQQIQDILHVLREFSDPKVEIEGDIMSDEYIEALIKSYTTANINIAELDPNPASSGIDSKKFPIVGEIENMVKTFLKINKTPVWTKDGYVLPYEGVTQYVKGVIPTSAMGEHSNKYYFDKEKTDSSKSKYKITMVAGSGKPDSRLLKIEGWDSFIIEKDLMPVKKMNNGKQEYIKVNGKYDKIEEYVKFDDFLESLFATQYGGTVVEATDETYTQFYDEYNSIFANKDKWLKEQFEPWTSGKTQSLTVFISPNKKITLGPLTNYEQKSNSTMQTFINAHFKGNKEKQQQFYEDAKEVKKQLDRFIALTSFVRKECENRGIEGSKVINPELEKADTVINDICVLQNAGRPSLPLQILGNTEPYDLTHIYNILKGTSATGDITTSISQSQIIQRMFDSIISMNKNKAEGEDGSGGGAGGGSALGKNQEGEEEASSTNKLTYAEIAKTIKFFFFTVINWSPDTELQDKVQYFHTVELRKLLKQMNFDSEFETYDTKKEHYTTKFTEEIKEITGYYTNQKLTHVVEISELFKKIEDAKQKINVANTYEMAITAVKAIVDETNNINASSLIGSIAGDGNTCVEQKTVGLGEQLAKHFSVSLRPRTVA